MGERRNKLLIYGILTFLVMLMIFLFSSQDGSSSGALSGWFLKTPFGRILGKILPPVTGAGSDADLRKFAHAAEFALLAFCSSQFCRALFIKSDTLHACFYSFAFCILYACSDECHQVFVPGRYGCIRDVLIDTTGAGICLVFVWFFFSMREGRK